MWNYTGQQFPWRDFDPNADLVFSFDFVEFVQNSGEGLTLASCDLVGVEHGLLDIAGPSVDGTVVTVRIKRTAEAAPLGKLIPFTLRPILSDAQQNDWTRLLRLREG